MKQLIEDYKRRLKTAMQMIEDGELNESTEIIRSGWAL
jgi:hypothetical protein